MSNLKTVTGCFAAALWCVVLIETVHSAAVDVSSVRQKGSPQGDLGIDQTDPSDDTGKTLPTFSRSDAAAFLEKYGYLDPVSGRRHGSYMLAKALREYQRFVGLKMTGRLDASTVAKMRQPRCGFPDKVKPGNTVSPRYNLLGSKWDKRLLTYKIVSFSKRLSRGQQITAISKAFKRWSDVTPLSFRQVTDGYADIEISFPSGRHAVHPNDQEFAPTELAHAFNPGPDPIHGDAHFNDATQWQYAGNQGFNVEVVAAHEFGHSLGLNHSQYSNALMATYYYYIEGLHQDDLAGIQYLYGSKRNPKIFDDTSAESMPDTDSSETNALQSDDNDLDSDSSETNVLQSEDDDLD